MNNKPEPKNTNKMEFQPVTESSSVTGGSYLFRKCTKQSLRAQEHCKQFSTENKNTRRTSSKKQAKHAVFERLRLSKAKPIPQTFHTPQLPSLLQKASFSLTAVLSTIAMPNGSHCSQLLPLHSYLPLCPFSCKYV